MQSTGHTSTQALSLTSMQGSTMTYGIRNLPISSAISDVSSPVEPPCCSVLPAVCQPAPPIGAVAARPRRQSQPESHQESTTSARKPPVERRTGGQQPDGDDGAGPGPGSWR